MTANPVPVLTIIGIYVVFYAVIGATDPETFGVNDSPTFGTSFGGIDILGDIIDAVIGFVELLIGALTFNIDGAPFYVQIPVAVAIIGSLGWSIASLIRGSA